MREREKNRRLHNLIFVIYSPTRVIRVREFPRSFRETEYRESRFVSEIMSEIHFHRPLISVESSSSRLIGPITFILLPTLFQRNDRSISNVSY
jgi:hypothetical protein